MHKFILGENPQAPESGGLWIIHLIDPVAIIEVVAAGEKQHTKNVKHLLEVFYENSDGIEENYFFFLHHFFTVDFNMLDEELAGKKVQKLLTQAMHWYKAYLEWEDKNIDDGKYD